MFATRARNVDYNCGRKINKTSTRHVTVHSIGKTTARQRLVLMSLSVIISLGSSDLLVSFIRVFWTDWQGYGFGGRRRDERIFIRIFRNLS